MLKPTAGRTIQLARARKRWTQAQLSKQSEVNASTISDIESGINRSPRMQTLVAIADVLDLDPEDMLEPVDEEVAS